MPRAVFIASAGHSGSTLLSFLLGSHRRAVGLGEAAGAFREFRTDDRSVFERPCSCGSRVADCPLWAPVFEEVADRGDLVDFYRRVLRQVDAVIGPEAVAVDASKGMYQLAALRATEADIAVIHLVRDVRSWSVAMRNSADRKGRSPMFRGFSRNPARTASTFVKRSHYALFLQWYRKNRDLPGRIAALGLQHATVGYDELAGSPHATLAQLCRELALDFSADELELAPGLSHSFGGNRMAQDPAKTSTVQYDTRWLARRDWMIPSLLLPNVMKLNRELVYSHKDRLPWAQ